MFEIRSYFIILISGFLSVFLYLKKKLHHFIKNCKSIVFSTLAEKNRSNLHNIKPDVTHSLHEMAQKHASDS